MTTWDKIDPNSTPWGACQSGQDPSWGSCIDTGGLVFVTPTILVATQSSGTTARNKAFFFNIVDEETPTEELMVQGSNAERPNVITVSPNQDYAWVTGQDNAFIMGVDISDVANPLHDYTTKISSLSTILSDVGHGNSSRHVYDPVHDRLIMTSHGHNGSQWKVAVIVLDVSNRPGNVPTVIAEYQIITVSTSSISNNKIHPYSNVALKSDGQHGFCIAIDSFTNRIIVNSFRLSADGLTLEWLDTVSHPDIHWGTANNEGSVELLDDNTLIYYSAKDPATSPATESVPFSTIDVTDPSNMSILTTITDAPDLKDNYQAQRQVFRVYNRGKIVAFFNFENLVDCEVVFYDFTDPLAPAIVSKLTVLTPNQSVALPLALSPDGSRMFTAFPGGWTLWNIEDLHNITEIAFISQRDTAGLGIGIVHPGVPVSTQWEEEDTPANSWTLI